MRPRRTVVAGVAAVLLGLGLVTVPATSAKPAAAVGDLADDWSTLSGLLPGTQQVTLGGLTLRRTSGTDSGTAMGRSRISSTPRSART